LVVIINPYLKENLNNKLLKVMTNISLFKKKRLQLVNKQVEKADLENE